MIQPILLTIKIQSIVKKKKKSNSPIINIKKIYSTNNLVEDKNIFLLQYVVLNNEVLKTRCKHWNTNYVYEKIRE